MNEFGLMEVVNRDQTKQEGDGNAGDKENKCLTQSSSKSSSPTIVNEKKEVKKIRPASPVTFYRCEGCGCHGLPSEFESPNSCSPSCTDYIQETRQQKLRKEKELKYASKILYFLYLKKLVFSLFIYHNHYFLIYFNSKEMKVKKKRKKLLQDEQTEKNKVSKTNDDDKSKDSEDTFDKMEEKSKPDTDEDTKDTNISAQDEENQGDSESKVCILCFLTIYCCD